MIKEAVKKVFTRKFKLGKKAAIELSIGTIVIIVIAMSMLILGIVLVRQVMCAGIILTDEVSRATENEIKSLFSSTETGVKCIGESGNEPQIGGGGSRQVICVINTDEQWEYEFKLKDAEFLGDAPVGVNIDDLVVSPEMNGKGWEGVFGPGEKTVTVAVLDVPRDIEKSILKLSFDECRFKQGESCSSNSYKESHPLSITLVPSSAFSAAIC